MESVGVRVSPREIEWARSMRAAIAGDVPAYDRLLHDLVRTLRPKVQRELARAGRGSADVEDIVQEVLLAVHLKRHTWDQSRPIGPWINAIARYKLVDALRKRGSRDDISIDLIAESLAAPEQPPNLSKRELETCMGRLSSNQQAVVRSIAIEGASIARTAVQLRMSPGAVRVALHRGLRALSKVAG
jgi:RNA polymerase sigma-70 factor (ECF subfamily)